VYLYLHETNNGSRDKITSVKCRKNSFIRHVTHVQNFFISVHMVKNSSVFELFGSEYLKFYPK